MEEGSRAPTGLPPGRIRVPEHVVHRSFERETVLLNLETGMYHGLNPVGGRMLGALEETGFAAAAAEQVAEHYGARIEQVRQDLAELCVELERRRLIVVDAASGS